MPRRSKEAKTQKCRERERLYTECSENTEKKKNGESLDSPWNKLKAEKRS
jgi:hypothetical protein